MPKSFPPIKNKKKHNSTRQLLASGVLGFLVSGSIYGVSLWSLLLILREADVIDNIISYRWCVAISYIYIFVRFYDRQLMAKTLDQ
jgi:hypothetical protein